MGYLRIYVLGGKDLDRLVKNGIIGLRPLGLGIGAITLLGSLLPYFFVDRILMNFYATQYTPLLAAGAAGVFHSIWAPTPTRKVLAVGFVAAATIVLLLYRPLAIAEPIHEANVERLFDALPWTRRVPVEGC